MRQELRQQAIDNNNPVETIGESSNRQEITTNSQQATNHYKHIETVGESSMAKAVFLDRDGIINIEKNYLYKIEDFEFTEGLFEVLLFLQNLGYLLFIVTNQSGIARGYYSEADFFILTDWMLQQLEYEGIHIAKVYFSPYHPEHGIGKYRKDSICRKPNPGMLLQARQEFNIDLKKSVLIGDMESDIETGINAGVGTTILVKNEMTVEKIKTKADFVANNIKEITSCLKSGNKSF